ncbi:hypothetical protein [Streptomyces sp. NPDC012746]|uniref:zinc finger domain-containing protein n=1 Tax=Streptomyces sp. NPDC012746 TaxID=3364845 RepID=UPI0036AAFD72
MEGQARRTREAFLAVYHERKVRAAAPGAGPGEWVNEYPPYVEDVEARGGYTPVADLDPARPFAVHLGIRRFGRGRELYYRYRFITWDLDAKTVSAERAATDADFLTRLLRAEGIEPVPTASGAPGGIHLWTGCTETVHADVVHRINEASLRLCPSLDVSPLSNPKQGLIRPPGAPHRNGGYSTLTDHTPAEAAHLLGAGSPPAEAFERLAVRLEALAAALPPAEPAVSEGTQGPPRVPALPAQRRAADDENRVPPSILARGPRVRSVVQDPEGRPRLDVPWRPLGARTLRALRHRPDRLQDHSALKHAPARGMALAGWTQAEGLTVVRDEEAAPALEWLRSERQADGSRRPRSAQETEALWARVWWLAVEDAARMPRRPQDDGRPDPESDEVHGAVADLFARMEAAGPARWLRQSGPADAAVLHVLAWLMLTAGSLDVSANIRRVGTLAGYSGQTAAQALWRLHRDGWITFTAEAERRAGKARRVALATDHVCPDHAHHTCALYVVPGHTGSDRSGTPRRAAAAAAAAPLLTPTGLYDVLAHHQAGLWHDLGHHAARTLWALRTLRCATADQLMQATGYRLRTVLRHLHRLQGLGLVSRRNRRRGHALYAVTDRTLYEAGQATGSADRTAHLAVTARIDQAQHDWLAAEEEYRSRPYKDRPRRPGPDQAVIPGMDPRGRAYPRDEDGRPDHGRARRIEAERIDAAGLMTHAQSLARSGALIDPAQLAAEPAATGGAAAPLGRRAVIASRYSCPHCHALPGDRCVIPSARGDRPAARWHAARRRRARALAEGQATG